MLLFNTHAKQTRGMQQLTGVSLEKAKEWAEQTLEEAEDESEA